MAKLEPSDVPGKKAGPNGSFPIGDPTHARMAIGGATRSYNAGNISKGTEDSIKAQARNALAGTPSAPAGDVDRPVGQSSAPHPKGVDRPTGQATAKKSPGRDMAGSGHMGDWADRMHPTK